MAPIEPHRDHSLVSFSPHYSESAFSRDAPNLLRAFLEPSPGIFEMKLASRLGCFRGYIEAHLQESQKTVERRCCHKRIWTAMSLGTINRDLDVEHDSIRTHIVVAILHEKGNSLTANGVWRSSLQLSGQLDLCVLDILEKLPIRESSVRQ